MWLAHPAWCFSFSLFSPLHRHFLLLSQLFPWLWPSGTCDYQKIHHNLVFQKWHNTIWLVLKMCPAFQSIQFELLILFCKVLFGQRQPSVLILSPPLAHCNPSCRNPSYSRTLLHLDTQSLSFVPLYMIVSINMSYFHLKKVKTNNNIKDKNTPLIPLSLCSSWKQTFKRCI